MDEGVTVICEQFGLAYERVLLPVCTFGCQSLRNEVTGGVLPTQWAPATPFDVTDDDEVQLTVLDLAPGETLRLVPSDEVVEGGGPRVEAEGSQAVVVNGARAVRLPRDGWVEQPFPGPIEGFRLADGQWFGAMSLVSAALRGHVSTVVESLGPCCAQWRTTRRWGEGGAASWVVRWASGSDTLLIAEQVLESGDAAVEWFPLGGTRARALVWGGGERAGPMQPLACRSLSGARRGEGRRLLGRLSHVSYFNQWNFSWVGFDGGSNHFVGMFTGWGGLWRRRGFVRPEIWQDDERGDFLRFPLRQGTRLFGLVFTDRKASRIDAPDARCILNRRKTQLSDLRLEKVRQWELEAPAGGRGPSLVHEADLAGFRVRLASDAAVAGALDAHAQSVPDGHATQVAAALWRGDGARLRACVRELLDFADKTLLDAAEGGYECVIIFHGRRAKRVAYDLDVLHSLGLIDESDRRRVCKALLALAYIFADPDYCRPHDFWPQVDPGEGMAEALADDMGDCPVPPNFVSEFFSTTAVVAELLEEHSLSAHWRAWAMEQLDRFLDTFFEPDGTYHESVNYHSHALNELLCQICPLRLKGVRDYFADGRIRGSFAHLVQIQMPPLSNALPAGKGKRCPLPADGNSGGEGLEMDYRGELMVGAAACKDSDPQLAGHLAHAWRRAGRPLLDAEHPVLTLLTLDPGVTPIEPAFESCWRRSLGVVSKARMEDGSPVWCLFRAGRATHHMDFDQGNVHLAAWDTVLLGDYGYHAHDSEGKPLVACETWLHNTVIYSRGRHMSSGYTGLEKAPEPVMVHLGNDFDWVVHRIVNTNFRRLDELSYRDIVPAPTTRHVRCYLFVKPDYFLIWDTFEEAHEPSTFWLHPWDAVVEEGAGLFRAGERGRPHLRIQFLLPRRPEVVENRRAGPLWSFAVTNDVARPYLTLLMPQREDRHVAATLAGDGLTVEVKGDHMHDVVHLPRPGLWSQLPELRRDS